MGVGLPGVLGQTVHRRVGMELRHDLDIVLNQSHPMEEQTVLEWENTTKHVTTSYAQVFLYTPNTWRLQFELCSGTYNRLFTRTVSVRRVCIVFYWICYIS